jgi:hypothetical protein
VRERKKGKVNKNREQTEWNRVTMSEEYQRRCSRPRECRFSCTTKTSSLRSGLVDEAQKEDLCGAVGLVDSVPVTGKEEGQQRVRE